jgi:hypothetical protein
MIQVHIPLPTNEVGGSHDLGDTTHAPLRGNASEISAMASGDRGVVVVAERMRRRRRTRRRSSSSSSRGGRTRRRRRRRRKRRRSMR